MAKVSGAHVIAGVLRSQLDQATSIGADETVALDDPAAFIAEAGNSGKMTIPIGLREELKNAGAAQAAFRKGGIGKVLLIP